MIKNSNLTIYHNTSSGWVKSIYNDIWWYSKKDADINETYSKENDIDVRVWNETNIENFKIGDIVVKGVLDFEIESQFDLDDYLVYNITKLKNNDYAVNKHIHLTASLFQTNVELLKATKEKQKNGTYINIYDTIDKYKVKKLNITDDEVSATIYGANITKMLRISSPSRNLENFLMSKVGNQQDNISYYYIKINNNIYKINSVSQEKIDIELI